MARTDESGSFERDTMATIGGFALVAASGVLAASFGLRSLLGNLEAKALVQGLGESLLILRWVAMWRPVEILPFEHWESHLDHAILDRLASIPIEFVFQPDDLARMEAR